MSDSADRTTPAGGFHEARIKATAMCECGHHWSVHAESRMTAADAICHGYIGSATPGPLREPCRCQGFRPWSGPRDTRTGAPVKPLTVSTAPGSPSSLLATSPAASSPAPDPDSVSAAPADQAALNARFGSDPEALAWARGHVQRLADKYRTFEADARATGHTERAQQWRKFANLLHMQLIGGSGCVITPFDERRPTLPDPGGIPW